MIISFNYFQRVFDGTIYAAEVPLPNIKKQSIRAVPKDEGHILEEVKRYKGQIIPYRRQNNETLRTQKQNDKDDNERNK